MWAGFWVWFVSLIQSANRHATRIHVRCVLPVLVGHIWRALLLYSFSQDSLVNTIWIGSRFKIGFESLLHPCVAPTCFLLHNFMSYFGAISPVWLNIWNWVRQSVVQEWIIEIQSVSIWTVSLRVWRFWNPMILLYQFLNTLNIFIAHIVVGIVILRLNHVVAYVLEFYVVVIKVLNNSNAGLVARLLQYLVVVWHLRPVVTPRIVFHSI